MTLTHNLVLGARPTRGSAPWRSSPAARSRRQVLAVHGVFPSVAVRLSGN
jgi:hypothetical protein